MRWHNLKRHDGGRGRIAGSRDLLTAADPGLNRFFAAVQVMTGIAGTIAVVFGFMQLTQVLWIHPPGGRALSAAQLTSIAAQHHGVTLLAMLLGGVIALLAMIAVTDPQPREQALTMLLMPIPLLATIALAIQLVTHRSAGIAVLAVVVGVGTYGRKFAPRFGSRVVVYGALLFIGYLFGFVSGGAITERDLGWIAVIAWLAVLINLLLKVLVYRPLDRGRLGRTARAFRARARTVVAAAAELFDATVPRGRASRRLHRRLIRLNGTGLVIDASLAAPGALPPGVSAPDAHARLFEVERLIHNVAHLAEQLAAAELPPEVREEVRGWLSDLRTGRGDRVARTLAELDRGDRPASLAGVTDSDVAAIHQLAGDVADAVASLADAPSNAGARPDANNVPFESAVTLIAGDLPGSALVSAQAAVVEGHGALLRRLRLEPAAQTAIRVAVAVAVASALGSIVSERRFYWAVLAVFVTFMGTNTSGEQVIKAIHRVAGTLVGVVIGSLLANAIGHSTWSLAVIIGALGLGTYFFKVSFAAFVTALTVALAQIYDQLGEYSNHVLALRLEETAIGGAVAIAAAIWIFPAATSRAARIAERAYLNSLADLLGRVAEYLREPGDAPLSSASRALDHAHQQLLTTARPLTRNPRYRAWLERELPLYTQTAHQARNLVADVTREHTLDPRVADDLTAATDVERDAVTKFARELKLREGPVDAPRLDDAPLASIEKRLADRGQLPSDHHRQLIRDLDRLDETIGELRTNRARQDQVSRAGLDGDRVRRS
jgi:uncharacterized membrane protein YgaE (UPF0421/DUF939 family)/MFS family permease